VHRWHAAATLLLFAAGALLGFMFLLTDASLGVPLLASALVTSAYALVRWRADRRPPRLLRVAAALVLLGASSLWAYELVAFASELAWTLSAPVWILVFGLGAGVVVTHFPRWRRAEIPLVLPVGVVIAACLFGWRTEESRIDCGDYLSVVRQKSVRVLIPATEEQAGCEDGAQVAVNRFPRHLWESPDGRSLVFTTQLRNRAYPPSKPTPGRLSGSICVTRSDGSEAPSCFGTGTAQGLAESNVLDRLFVASWGSVLEGGRRGGYVYALSRSDPTRVVGRRETPHLVGELFYDPEGDMLGVLSDEAEWLHPMRASTLEPLEPVPTPVIPGDIHYDEKRREGVYCFAAGPLKTIDGAAFGAVAFSTGPYAFRPLASARSSPWLWFGFSWGCDWDPDRRRVYSAIASLGVLLTIDYDTAEVLETTYTGMGIRSVAFDRERRRVYLGSYLSGWVKAIDLDSGAVVGEWLAGRFVRTVVIARDGRRLLVSSNLGIVEINLS
jgi:hypothetical protein